jgi:hypothetical protein
MELPLSTGKLSRIRCRCAPVSSISSSRLFIQDGTNTPQLAAVGRVPPADIGAKPFSVIPRGLPRGGFILSHERWRGSDGREASLPPSAIF